jgi:CheY-like chemotaxis protein
MNIVKRKILIVEDDEINQMMIAENLEAMGMSYETAENGKIALEKIENSDYDVVLLDLKMPVMDGIEVLRRIKSNNRINHIPVIVISSDSEFSRVIECIEMGALDYLTKPFNSVLLKARLKSSLTSKDLYEQQQIYLQMIKEEQRKLELLLFSSTIVSKGGLPGYSFINLYFINYLIFYEFPRG